MGLTELHAMMGAEAEAKYRALGQLSKALDEIKRLTAEIESTKDGEASNQKKAAGPTGNPQ